MGKYSKYFCARTAFLEIAARLACPSAVAFGPFGAQTARWQFGIFAAGDWSLCRLSQHRPLPGPRGARTRAVKQAICVSSGISDAFWKRILHDPVQA
ncbi:hypothetical protein DTO195F2_8712 [Paecilomyces variotii]|nr:hypothetical protein DTO195F2_8712 [Paecilomyces variotii]KAJ9306921.1 hypothetical protein DTO217A2_3511 [Paecilomyces variotii]KAJ9373036.1 hypothetical protein DTO282E5_2446 [Paecilomyces variotii]